MSSFWDQFQPSPYDYFFGEADRIHEIYQNHESNQLYSPSNINSVTGISHHRSPFSSGSMIKYEQFPDFGSYEQFPDFGRSEYEYGGTSAGAARNADNVYPDDMDYEQLIELGESSGSVSKGLTEEQISVLPTHKFKPQKNKSNSTNNETECVVCKTDFQKGDTLITLPCTHRYHEDCIKTWLRDNKTCCLCKMEVAI